MEYHLVDLRGRNDIFVILTPFSNFGQAYSFLSSELESEMEPGVQSRMSNANELIRGFLEISEPISVEEGMYALFFVCVSMCTSTQYNDHNEATKHKTLRVLQWFLKHFGHSINLNLYITTGELSDTKQILAMQETLQKPLKMAENYSPLYNLLINHLKESTTLM